MSVQPSPALTAGTDPEVFADDFFFSRRKIMIGVLIALTLLGFGLRVGSLGAESLSEDELNKLQTVNEYRADGLSGRNGEHPFLMKGLQTASVIAAEKWNAFAAPARRVSDEAALRFPTALVGTLTIIFLFLLVKELFGSTLGLIVAALWAVDPNAVGFDRIAKEDSFLLCFFVLANVFWLRGQSAAERGEENWTRRLWAAAFAFAAMFASKYLPHLFGISAAYYIIFQAIPATKWRFGKTRWLTFFIVTGIAFIVFNPTITLPETWREMLKFSGEKRIGHDSYEFMGQLYKNQLTAWLAGVPWTFYYVYILVKTPLVTLFFFLVGLPLMFKKRLGDGRWFFFFWALMWFMPFSVLGGKFTRYFAVAEPLILVAAAVGFYYFIKWISDKFNFSAAVAAVFQTIAFAVLIVPSLIGSLAVAPHFRLHTNRLGGGAERAGFYFPHDEFYDAATREIVAELASRARPNAAVAVETPYLFEFYAKKVGRGDLNFISLSDKTQAKNLAAGDFVVAAKGRRYFSNDAGLKYLEEFAAPIAEIKTGAVTAAEIYQLDEDSAGEMRRLSE